MSRKRFIDKNKAVSFHLLHRSQRDPLAADESAPQRVLVEAANEKGDEGLSRTELNAKYGIYFDDDYNYLQHLKDSSKQHVVWVESTAAAKKKGKGSKNTADASESSSGPSIQLPSSVFASHVEEEVGLLNKAAPDHSPPDEVEAELMHVMDDDYVPNPDDELEDNFFELAGGLPSDDEDDEEIEIEVDEDDGEDVDSDQFDEDDVYDPRLKHQAKSHFTEYSTTSQGVLSTVEMEALNERFENFMGQYEDLEVGGLESEEIAGTLDPNSDRLLQLADEYGKTKEKPTIDKEVALREVDVDDEEEDLVVMTVYENVKEDRMDCESILSTYSNKKNLPHLIDAPNKPSKIIVNKKGIARDDKPKLTKKTLAKLNMPEEDDSDSDTDGNAGSESSFGNETLASRISMLSVRPEGETSDERKSRKHELKALRRERIQEKKANQLLTKVLSERQAQSQRDKLKAKQGIRYH